MFSIQFCVCFYSILYVCHCHFTGNIYENCTKKNEIKMVTNLNLRKRHEAIIFQNNTTAPYLDKNISKLNVVTGNIAKKVIRKKKKSTEKYKPIENIDKGIIKKNYSIFGIDLTLYELDNKKQLVTKKMISSDDYLENGFDKINQTESVEDTGAFTIFNNDKGEEQNTLLKNENITKIVTKISHNNGTDKNLPKHDLSKNIDNNDTTKNIQKLESPNDIKPLTPVTTAKQDTTEEKSSVINNETVTESMTKVFQNSSMEKNVQTHDLPKNVQKRDIGIPVDAANHYLPEDFENHRVKKYQYYDLQNRIENSDTPKNINHNFNDVRPYDYRNDEMYYKHHNNKKNVMKKDKHTKRYDDNVSQNVRPQLQTILNNDLIKKSLDEFKMVRRKTHYTMPNVEFKTDNDKRDIYRYQDLAYPEYPEYDNEAKINGARNHIKPDYYVDDIRHNMYPIPGEFNHIYHSAEEQNDKENFKALNKIMARQKQIIEKLTKLQKEKRKQTKKHDFAIIVSEIEAKQEMQKKWKNYTDFTFETTTRKTTTKLTTTEKPTTILTLFDETEVRLALKNDPHVKRILKMANLKREKYLNNVRRHLTRNNYTHDAEYAKKLAKRTNREENEAAEATFVDSVQF